MKRIFLLFFIIIFSSLFLALPNKIYAESKCGQTCKFSSECKSENNECPICQADLTAEYGICVSREEAYGEQQTTEEPQVTEEQQTTETTEAAKEFRDKLGIPELTPRINKVVNYSTGIGGLIAFILIVIGGFQIILSAGNPERIKAGKEMITSAIAGLLLIIFAVFILRLIGYDILKIPGFGQ